MSDELTEEMVEAGAFVVANNPAMQSIPLAKAVWEAMRAASPVTQQVETLFVKLNDAESRVGDAEALNRLLSAQLDHANEQVETLTAAASRVLEWWPEGSEDGRAGQAKGDGFADDIRSLRAALKETNHAD